MKVLRAAGPVLILALGLACATGAAGQGNVMQPAPAAVAVHFVPPAAVDLPRILPAPPAPGSLAAQADLAAVLQAQAWRNEEQVAWARLIDKQTVFSVFGPVLGSDFRAEKLPLFVKLVADVTDDLRPVSEAAKKIFPRARPYAVDARVQPCIPAPKSDTYPSGHALMAHLMAAILERIYPAQAEAIRDQADRACWGRILGGVHFPTDLEGGRLVAIAMMAQLDQSPAFRDALARCQLEAKAQPARKAA